MQPQSESVATRPPLATSSADGGDPAPDGRPAPPESPRKRRRDRLLMAAGITGFVAASAVLYAEAGLVTSHDWIFLWLLLGLLAFSLTDLKRWGRGLVVDWLPFMAIMVFYDLSYRVSELLPVRPHALPQLHVDELLFGTPIPTLRLQHALHSGPQIHWYDYGAWGVYMTHLFVTLAVAAVLWKVAYPRFRQWRTMVVCLAGMGFVTYVLYPAIPPWMASRQHYLPHTFRIFSDVWRDTGVQAGSALLETHSGFYNQVAAVPSLHAAYPLLVVLFFWSTARWWARAGLIAYALFMALTLVYTAEHYVSDILLGWIYAVATYAAVTAVSRRLAQRSRKLERLDAAKAEPAVLR